MTTSPSESGMMTVTGHPLLDGAFLVLGSYGIVLAAVALLFGVWALLLARREGR